MLNLKYNNTIGDLEAKYDAKERSSNETTKTLAWVGYGVGAACVATGAILYYLGWSKRRAVLSVGAISGNPGFVLGGAL
jgi:hypothetical protein